MRAKLKSGTLRLIWKRSLTSHVTLAQALQSRTTTADARAEKQLVSLLSIPLDTYDVVTVLGLGNYPNVIEPASSPNAQGATGHIYA